MSNDNLQTFIDEKPPKDSITCIFGPTASGKSAAAIGVAQAHKGVIVNADSMQVYKELRSLSARPSVEEEAMAPHRLYGYLDGKSACNAAQWAAQANAEIEKIKANGQHPIVIGGTGLYFRALLEGLSPIPTVDEKVETRVRAFSNDALDATLSITGETHLKDQQRKKRAVSVYISSGKPLAHWQAIEPTPTSYTYRFAILWPEREALYARINQRFEQMIRHGDALEEVRELAALGLSTEAPVMRAIGVPELIAHQRGQLDLEAAIALAQQATRRYAKRQFTWMRSEKEKRQNDPNFRLVEL
ncbi:MAG: tRNA (adenosine(37)-N6)-dimethylallyltransferase MiaA [Alphaproteobacteria bacterium]